MNSSISPSQIATPETPWLGLRSFTEDAHDYFFGRQAELEDLYGRIVDKPLTIFFGQSGLGKSSLIQAALIPSLRRQGFLPVRIRIDHEPNAPAPEEQMLHELQHALYGEGFASQADRICEGLADPAFDAASFLWLMFHDPVFGFLPGAASPAPRPVFLIDQFEEIFTLGERPMRRPVSYGFREALAALVENRPPSALRARLESDDELSERINYRARTARVLLSLREDFLHVLERWRRFMPSLMENRLELRMLNGTQALEAVVRPGQLRDGLPAIVSNEVGHAIVRFVAGAESEVPLAEIDAVPPLLSLVCAELNAQRLVSGETQISRAQFEGHSDEILQGFYRRSFEPISYGDALEGMADSQSALSALQRLIEDKLLSADGFRESIAFDTIARDLARDITPEAARTVLNQIVERRLLTVEERGGVRRLELAHDVLAPIVRASRDERHESEALARARRDQERAESAVRAALQQRNRLRRWAALALGLAALSVVAAVAAWIGLENARKAAEREKLATAAALEATKKVERALLDEAEAKKAAEAGFESAFAGLRDLYDEYQTKLVGNTPGLSRKEADTLGAGLRALLLPQLEGLHRKQPNHRGCLQLIGKLNLDAINYIAYTTKDWLSARTIGEAAIKLFEGIESMTREDAEIYCELLMLRARTSYYLKDKAVADEQMKNTIEKIDRLKGSFSDSWRLDYVRARTQNLSVLDNAKAGDFLEIAQKLRSLREKSNQQFDVVCWEYITTTNEYNDERRWKSMSINDLDGIIDLIDKQILPKESFTLIQIETVADTMRNLIINSARRLVTPERDEDIAHRQAVLKHLDTVITKFEVRLPKSPIVYARRGEYLALEAACSKAGLEIRSKDAMLQARTKYRERAAAIGVADSIRDAIAEGFDKYAVAKKGSPEEGQALGAIAESMKDVGLLDLAGFDSLVANEGIRSKIAGISIMKADDPLLPLCSELLERYIDAFANASLELRVSYLDNFSIHTRNLIDRWDASPDQASKLVQFWDRCLAQLPLAKLISADRDAFLGEIRACVIALNKRGRTNDALAFIHATLGFCDELLAERPWDWYAKKGLADFCLDMADAVKSNAPLSDIQALLRRGWLINAKIYGKEAIMDRVKHLPFKGEVPANGSPEDKQFFALWVQEKTPENKTGGGNKDVPSVPPEPKMDKEVQLVIDTLFSGKVYPSKVYVYPGPNGLSELMDQFTFIEKNRGGVVPKEIIDSFKAAKKFADDHRTSFCITAAFAKHSTKDTEQFDKIAPMRAKISKDDDNSIDANFAASLARLRAIARENNVNFIELCDYAFGSTTTSKTAKTPPKAREKSHEERLSEAEEAMKAAEAAYTRATTEGNRNAFADALANMADVGLHLKRWSDVEAWTRKSLVLAADNPASYASLGIALLFQGKYEEALKVFRAHWDDKLNGGTISNTVYGNLASLEKDGITHPDIVKAKAALPQPPKDLTRILVLIRGKLETGGPFWVYVAVKPSKYAEMTERQKAGKLDLYKFEAFGEIVVSGDGESPPEDVTKKVADMYQTTPDKLKVDPK